ncbi:MAG: DUF502 domain-containing protein [Parvularculaceae bacterium]
MADHTDHNQTDFGGGDRRSPQSGKQRPRRSFWSSLWSSFMAGVVVVAPIGITIALIYWFVTDPMAKVDRFVRNALPGTEISVIPGLGVLVAFVAIIGLGAFAKNFIGRAFIKAGQEILEAVPVVRQLYRFFKNVFETALQQKERSFKEVALVEYPREGLWALAFVVGDGKGEIVPALADQYPDPVSVFVPTVPNPTSGFLIFVSRSRMKTLRMSVEDAAKMVFSLGLVVPDYASPEEAVRRLEELAKTAREKKPFHLHLPGRGKSNRNG